MFSHAQSVYHTLKSDSSQGHNPLLTAPTLSVNACSGRKSNYCLACVYSRNVWQVSFKGPYMQYPQGPSSYCGRDSPQHTVSRYEEETRITLAKDTQVLSCRMRLATPPS